MMFLLITIAIVLTISSSVVSYSITSPITRNAKISRLQIMSSKKPKDTDERVFRVEIPLGEGEMMM